MRVYSWFLKINFFRNEQFYFCNVTGCSFAKINLFLHEIKIILGFQFIIDYRIAFDGYTSENRTMISNILLHINNFIFG